LQQLIDALGPNTADKFGALAQETGRRRGRQASRPRRQLPDRRRHPPLRMFEEIKSFVKRDSILVVDGQETLNFGRQVVADL